MIAVYLLTGLAAVGGAIHLGVVVARCTRQELLAMDAWKQNARHRR